MTKYLDMIGWDDVPHLQPPHITKEELDELEGSILPHQRQARRTGRPALGSGAIYPIDESTVLIDPIPLPKHWPRAYALDVGWRKTAALWGAWDQDANIFYLTHEYYVAEQQPIVHAHSIRSVGAWMTGAIDPAAEYSSQRDGAKLKQEYMDLGLKLVNANNAVSAGLLHCLTLMQGGQLKVFKTLTSWTTEFRLYRRDEKGKIVKTMDHLMDDMRYLLNTQGIWHLPISRTSSKAPQGEW